MCNENHLFHCDICCHGVMDMEKHLLTPDHIRRARIQKNGTSQYNHGVARHDKLKRGESNDESPFPGRCLLKTKRGGRF